MVLESNNLNQNFGYDASTFMYGNIPMNTPLNNVFPNEQVAFNSSSQKTPMNLNFSNSNHQVLAIGGSSLNPPVGNFLVDPFLPASSFSLPLDHSSYIKNNGLMVGSSSDEVMLNKQYRNLIHFNKPQQLQPSMEVQTNAMKLHVNSSHSANPCIDGDKTVVDLKAKKRSVQINKNCIKGHWMQEEDRMLLNLVERFGNKNWSSIARMMPGRLGKQLRERYNNHLKPGLKKEAWTEEEERKLIQAHVKIGNKWAEISKLLPGRSESSIKNRWNATKRKCLNSIHKNKKSPKLSSLFENYVNTMFNTMGQSNSISAESTAMDGSSSGGSNNKQALANGSVDCGLSSFDPNVLANDNGSISHEV